MHGQDMKGCKTGGKKAFAKVISDWVGFVGAGDRTQGLRLAK